MVSLRRNLQKLSDEQNCTLGLVSGILTKAINYPLLAWTTSTQQGLPVPLKPSIIYRGMPVATFSTGTTVAVQFGTTSFFTRILATRVGHGDRATVGGAFLGGAVAGVPCSVWELCMIQQQRFGGSLFNTPQAIVRAGGVTSLLRGVMMTVGRESLFTMAMLGFTPLVQNKLVETSGLGKNSALAAGSLLSAGFAGAMTHPMDTIKTCMQGDLGRGKYAGVIATGKSIAAEYGVAQGFFKGLSFRTGTIATSFFMINAFKQRLEPMLFPDPVQGPRPRNTRVNVEFNITIPNCTLVAQGA
jgi:solute carrier family 25 carnitine/acylcarnitine transporter 20/29